MPIAIYALSLAAFAVGTAEFVISGILPPLAGDLGVSIAEAGLLVTAYAIGVAIGGPLLSILTNRWPRRNVLIAALVLFTLSQVLCAIAPDYGLLLVARLASSLAHGMFFAAGGILVAMLVPAERRGGAFALFSGGITVANLLGLPGGTAIAVAFGWRASFLAVALLGLAAIFILFWRLPRVAGHAGPGPGLGAQFRELRHQQVWLSYIAIALTMTGALAFGTYQVPIMLEITHLTPEIVPLYLLVGGVGSVFGIWVGGRGTDWRPMPTVIAVLILQAVLYFTMIFAMTDKVGMLINLFGTSAFGFAFSTPLQARIIATAHAAPNLASGFVATAFNIGIGGGALIGAMLLNAGVSYADLPGVGIVTSLLAAGAAGLSFWLEKRSAKTAAA